MSEASLNDRQFFGHPIGLRTLFLTEMWERMSYYGMRALLVLYMTGAVTGFNPGLGWSQLDAQAIYGVYVGLVYFMVVPGGWLADNILGHQRAVLYGAIIALGHLTLAVPLSWHVWVWPWWYLAPVCSRATFPPLSANHPG